MLDRCKLNRDNLLALKSNLLTPFISESGVMAKRKTTFPCGHTGRGKFCHRCAQKKAKKAEDRQQRQSWQATFEADPIDLSGLPNTKLVKKARHILQAIAQGEPYINFKGKRLNHDRTIITVPLNRDYRLIFYDLENGLSPQKILSHEDYNVKKPK